SPGRPACPTDDRLASMRGAWLQGASSIRRRLAAVPLRLRLDLLLGLRLLGLRLRDRLSLGGLSLGDGRLGGDAHASYRMLTRPDLVSPATAMTILRTPMTVAVVAPFMPVPTRAAVVPSAASRKVLG